MEFKIVTAQKEDLPNILKLQKECYISDAELHNEFNIPPLTQTIESLIEEFENGWLFLKMVHKNEIIATGRGFTQNDITHIAKLAVHNDFQNQKLGQTMLKKLEFRLSNCKKYELFTGYKSERNIYLYKKLGYNEFKRAFINENLTLVFLEKFI